MADDQHLNAENPGGTRADTPHGFTALATGTRLSDRYIIDHVIAAGGFGITYAARHAGLGRVVAIKEHFPRQFAYREASTSAVRASDPRTFAWALDRFLQEGRALAQCKHPHVVDVSDVFEANGTAYMVLGYEDGQSLAQWLSGLGRPPTQADLDGILAPLLDALAFVHAQGLLHRDLAPDNIMIRRDGKPCLIDFGSARTAIAQRSQVMSAIIKIGYSPPEQYTSTSRVQGPWSDIYALGATLYRAVTGTVPPEATERLMDDSLRPIAESLPGASAFRASFLAGIDAALRTRQTERPQSVEAWRQMLLSTSNDHSGNMGRHEEILSPSGARKSLRGEPLSSDLSEHQANTDPPALGPAQSDQRSHANAVPMPDRLSPEPPPPDLQSRPIIPQDITADVDRFQAPLHSLPSGKRWFAALNLAVLVVAAVGY